MKHSYFRLLMAVLAIILFSCERESEEFFLEPETQDLSLNDAKQYFEATIIREGVGEFNVEHQPKRQNFNKTPEWGRAYMKNLPTGRAVIVPLTFSKEISYKLTDGRYEPINGKSYMLMYKDTNGIVHAEVVTRMPDSDYLNSEKGSSSFSGAVLVEDWEGRLIKGFEISKGKIRSLVSIADSIKPEKREEITPGELGATITSLSVYCQTTTWRSCAYMDGEYKYCQVMYSETSCWGSWGGGSYTDDSHYWDEDGGGSADNYLPPAAPVFEVKLDPSFSQNEKLNCIYLGLIQGGTLSGVTKNFMGENSLYDLIWKGGVLDGTTLGATYPPTYPYTDPVTIIVDINKANERPTLMVAKTLLHEAIHAQLTGWAQSVDYTLSPDNFPGLFDYYARFGSEQGDHQLMAAH